ncbi:MAG: MarR family transcriptional regulator [Oscillospiraceae bacterium]|nr:MarR family transcriptional regulator [Oscillospiraceae bacterium]
MKISGMNGDTTKRVNRQQVLRLLSTEPGISRTEIAARMGLVKMTVSNIIAEMLRSGMVGETRATGIEKPGAGRKLTGLCFSDKAPVVAGLWLTGRQVYAGIFSMELKLLKQTTRKVEPGNSIDTLAAAIASMMESLEQPLLGIGMALGTGWDSSLGIQLSERLNVPAFAMADVAADAAVVARFTNFESYFCLSVGQAGPMPTADGGVRAGIVVHNTLLGGPDGCCPLGQMSRHGGRLADVASAPAICRRCNEALETDCRTLSDVQAACRENPSGNPILCEAFGPLMDMVANLCLATRPEALIINADLAGFGEDLREYFFSRLNVRLGDSAPIITSSHYGTDNTMYGAACLVLEKIFRGDLGYDLFFKE